MATEVNFKNPSVFSSVINTAKNAAKGAFLGAGVVTAITPLLYIKNRLQTEQKVVPAHLMRGAPLLALNIVPQTAVAISVNELMKRGFKEEKLTSAQKAVAAMTAGAFAGAVSAPMEFVVQNYQNSWRSSLLKTAQAAWKEEGVFSFTRGSSALAVREAMYAGGYLVLAGSIKDKVQKKVKSEVGATVIGAAFSGLIVGAITNIPDVFRANKQWLERNWGYIDACKQLKIRQFMSGVSSRSTAVVIANLIMVYGTQTDFSKLWQNLKTQASIE